MAMLVYASMHIISRPGYELLIDQSIAKAHLFADKIEAQQNFQLVTRPELCLLTYRFAPKEIQTLLERTVAILEKQVDKTLNEELNKLNGLLNELTVYIQKKQRERGFSFVSRTTLTPKSLRSETTIVFRVVLANPLTTDKILDKILVEQHALAAQNSVLLERISKQAESIRNWITNNGH
jgi:glutamate decarboxylase